MRAEDVDKAVAQRNGRSNLVEERLQELVAEGTIRIETEGRRVGQVNSLEVLDLGDYRFGCPVAGDGESFHGPGHGGEHRAGDRAVWTDPLEGFLILTGYLAGQYGQEWPLALRATLTFEQSYEGVDGDSASSTELYACCRRWPTSL